MAKDRLRIVPLGGVGEVGKNMLLVEYGNDILLVDGGLKFPEEEMLGIDVVIPDITYLVERKDRIRGWVITHGHEDHIGGLPYLLNSINVPVYATRLTRGLIDVKLKERPEGEVADLRLLEPEARLSLGSFDIEPFRVSHSIPDGVGLAIHTPAGTVVHSGDFKFDQTPVDGVGTDIAKLAEIGRRGVLVLLCDCIRAELPGYTPSERLVSETFNSLIARALGRVIITTFASNISRLQQAIDAAYEYGRKVAVVGWSMENNVKVAADLDYLHLPEDILLEVEDIYRLSPDRVVLLTTGSQGEPSSVLSRVASSEYRRLRIMAGDTVVFSASPIPGNEETVARTINNLCKLGAEVIYGATETVHVSGHAAQEELRLMINLLRPKFCVPIHGEYRHMVLFRKLAQQVGMDSEQVLLAEVGDVLEFDEGYGRIAGKIPVGSVLVDGLTVGGISEVVLRDRQHLSRDGVFIVAVALNRQTGKLVAGPDIVTRGFGLTPHIDELLENARVQVYQAINQSPNGEIEYGFVVQKIKSVLSKYLYQQTRRRPMILPVVTEI